MPWTIYALADPATDEVRYIGKAKNLGRRIREHRRDRGPTRKAAWLRDLYASGREPVVVVLQEGADDQDWSPVEVQWIARYLAAGADLVNTTVGGGRSRTSTGPRPRRVITVPDVVSGDASGQARVAHARSVALTADAADLRQRRNDLVRAPLARAVGCSPELVAAIVTGRT